MLLYEEIKNKIDDLEVKKFNFHKEIVCDEEIYVSSLLRTALIIYNNITMLENKTEKKTLLNRLNLILSNKLKQLNPNFSDSIIQNMLYCYQRGLYQYPIDILVISDAVFIKEGTYDDFGNLYKKKTVMFFNNSYFDVYDSISFTFDGFSFELTPKNDKDDIELTKEDDMRISKFISDNINVALMSVYQACVTKPLYELNTNGLSYGYQGLVANEVRGVGIFLNKKFKAIAKDIINKKESDIEMIVQDGDDIIVYLFHQSFSNNSPIWSVQKLDVPIWKLSEAALKMENSASNPLQKKIGKSSC